MPHSKGIGKEGISQHKSSLWGKEEQSSRTKTLEIIPWTCRKGRNQSIPYLT